MPTAGVVVIAPADRRRKYPNPDDAETIMNGIDATDVDTHREAVAELARAYTGWRASDDER